MVSDHAGEQAWAERWDLLYHALAAEPRRMIVSSLLNEPPERKLELPDAAESPNQPMETETLTIELCHHHLPLLAEAGYIRWQEEPFIVQRGPRFEETAAIIELVTESVDELPASLVNNCKIFEESVRNA